MIEHNQSQEPVILFDCTFNSGLVGNCTFDSTTAENITRTLKISLNGVWNTSESIPPDHPLSDATSVFSPTINGEMCEFPYEIKGYDNHFCQRNETISSFTCLTQSGESECVSGEYAYVLTYSEKIVEEYISQNIFNPHMAEPQCLTFYYYFTNDSRDASIKVAWESNAQANEDDPFIVQVLPQTENKWYKSQTTFVVLYYNYKIKFEFYAEDNSSNTNPFYLAIDDILITSGSCEQLENKTDITDTTTPRTPSTSSVSVATDVTENGNTNEATASFSTSETTTNPISTPEATENLVLTSETTTNSIPTLDTTTKSIPTVETTTKSISTRETTKKPVTTSTKSDSTTSTMKSTITTTTTEELNNFGIIHGLSFSLGILVIMTNLFKLI